MQANTPIRASTASIATSVFLVLLAMMLPVCHMHPLLDKTAPEHCTICMTLHATPPLGIHLPPVIRLYQTGQVLIPNFPAQSSVVARFTASRAPPLPAC
jgi:hypothetical protein